MIPAKDRSSQTGIIAWFVKNPIAANLLMLMILAGGWLTAGTINKQLFPQPTVDEIGIDIAYPGASAKEVELGIALKVEDALGPVQGIQQIVTFSNRDDFSAQLKLAQGHDPQAVLNEVKNSIDAISSLPENAEKPVVQLYKHQQQAMYVSLYGDLSQHQLKRLGNTIYEELRALPSISIVRFSGGLDYEISVEIDKGKLREYQLSFQEVAEAIRRYSGNMAAGQVRSKEGVVSLRIENQAYTARDFNHIPIVSVDDGTRVLLQDIAQVNDGFVDEIQYSRFNGKNAVSFFIGANEQQSIADVAEIVRDYVEQKSADLPEGVVLQGWIDFTYYLEDRLQTMLDNIKWGALLVFVLLGLFLQMRLAFWVMMGLPVSFMGALLLMPTNWIDVTLNVSSLFGFILVLGIVVDDAIVISESVHSRVRKHGHSLDSVVAGVKTVALPVTVGVVTTIIVFVPMLFMSGGDASASKAIAWVVILCLLFSLVESKWILPAHLYHFCPPVKTAKSSPLDNLRAAIDTRIERFLAGRFVRLLHGAMAWRYVIIAAFISILLFGIGLVLAGVIKYVGIPKIPHDYPKIEIAMAKNSAPEATLNALQQIESVVYQVESRLKQEYGRGMLADLYVNMLSRSEAELTAKLVEPEDRPIDTFALSSRWRGALPDIPGLQKLVIVDDAFGLEQGEGDIGISFESGNFAELEQAAEEFKRALKGLPGISNITDSRQHGSRDVKIVLKPLAYNLGLSHALVAEQVNYGFYGLEAQRVIRDGEEIRVMIRYPEYQRQTFAHIEDTLITLGEGVEIPLSAVADVYYEDSLAEIRRENGKLDISIWGDIDSRDGSEVEARFERLVDQLIPDILAKYPSVAVESGGRIIEQEKNQQRLLRNYLLCCLLIFSLIAILMKSYLQPFIIMSAIPFSVIGAGLGHLLLGMNLSSFSVFGIIAASGVCINDALVLVDFINRARRERGLSIGDAIVESIQQRFRAVILTSITTFVGLIPIMAESSLQAKLVVPMAVSLAFGVLFATLITLVLVPCLYFVADDMKKAMGKSSALLLGWSFRL
ncbi:efflux RND transporter permease subunit [Exilibacterium tricleocarpae]|uniref:Efflux RND transporter permease subunit n=1 Tax=Exilibacterium tricleocarpae TaxID=2591008 RepID=A0A545U3C5_9GAMM|nr:efflux RND transporter permease subunit [Exilibacterium tricleocarpae]TQV83987.1 efflux RND transporter permease subunit [Exilibacterium tricleocarpae]